MNQDRLTFALGVGLLIGCASTRNLPDEDLSATGHEQAAEQDRATAHEIANRYDNRAVRFVELYPEQPPVCDKSLPGSCSPFWTMTRNPTDRELSLAAAYRTRARRHRLAAQQLRDAEVKACSGVGLSDQDLSPLLRRRDIAAVEEIGQSAGRGPAGGVAGAAIAFEVVPDLTRENLQKIVDCHLARNAALGWEQGDNSACPLNVKGARAKVRWGAGRLVVDVTATDAAAALEIVQRARALVAPVPVSLR